MASITTTTTNGLGIPAVQHQRGDASDRRVVLIDIGIAIEIKIEVRPIGWDLD
jgi:hypothetical protein